jgi:hypothetical protein
MAPATAAPPPSSRAEPADISGKGEEAEATATKLTLLAGVAVAMREYDQAIVDVHFRAVDPRALKFFPIGDLKCR